MFIFFPETKFEVFMELWRALRLIYANLLNEGQNWQRSI